MKILMFIALLLPLAGCFGSEKTVKVDQTPLTRPSLIIPNVDKFNAKKVNWIIITEDNADEVFAKLKKEGKVTALFAVTENGYNAIAINTKEALRVILQQKSAIQGYKKYYISANNTIYKYNKSLEK